MKKFLTRALPFCLIPLLCLYVLAYMVDTGLKRSHHVYYQVWNDLFASRINADVLVLGSSRAYEQVSPKILDSILHTNSYNLGLDGSNFKTQYACFRTYLRYNKKPKYILQEIGYTSTFTKNNSLPAIHQFMPYLQDSSIWQLVTHAEVPVNNLERYFPLYKYNNALPIMAEGMLSYFGHGAKPEKYKGYLGRNKTWHVAVKINQAQNIQRAFPVDSESVALVHDFLNFCRDSGIKVILFYPPAYIQTLDYVKNQKEILDSFNSIAAQYSLPFYNYMYDSMNYSKTNFYNPLHLTKKASEVFTTRFAKDIQPLIK